MTDISVQIGPIRHKNPVFIASGICGYAEEYSPLVNLSRLGGVVTKTITMQPRKGNLPPRIHELPHGMLNSIGLENVGLDRYLAEKLPQLNQHPEIGVMVSVAAETEEEFIHLADAFAARDGYDGLELNLSCPNVAGEALDQGRNPQLVERIARIVKSRLPAKSLWIKVTPNITDVGLVARAAEQGGADAVAAINTVVGIDFDLETGRPVFARGSAGYSGPAILPIALQKVWECAKAVSIPIVGIGGITAIDDARKFFLAGATAIQVGTALFSDPGLPERIVDALQQHPEWITQRALKPASGRL
jgi:dihydroorotate dehydrogenase (NAD+) catalytic subunit